MMQVVLNRLMRGKERAVLEACRSLDAGLQAEGPTLGAARDYRTCLPASLQCCSLNLPSSCGLGLSGACAQAQA